MATKCLSANQCIPLHQIYGPDHCCLCNARAELRELRDAAKDVARNYWSLERWDIKYMWRLRDIVDRIEREEVKSE